MPSRQLDEAALGRAIKSLEQEAAVLRHNGHEHLARQNEDKIKRLKRRLAGPVATKSIEDVTTQVDKVVEEVQTAPVEEASESLTTKAPKGKKADKKGKKQERLLS